MFEYSKPGMFNLRYNYQTNFYRPPVDVLETDTGFLVRVEIAGMQEDDFDIKFDNGILSVVGNRIDPIKNQTFHQMEIHFGEFRIEIKMNQPIQNNPITAEYKNGLLEILLLKAKPIEIPITDKDA
jgi:HSP20 family protein